MLSLTCHCGQIRVETDKKPEYINDCNCTFCAKSGAMWGYYDPSEVRVTGEAAGYSRADRDDPGARLQFCANCGSTTYFTLTDSAIAKYGNSVMGVNLRLIPEAELAGVEIRYPDGLGWSGEGEVPYVRAARVIGGEDAEG